MQTESAAFTAADLPRFFEEIYVWDVRNTADRLRRANSRVHDLAGRIPDGAPTDSPEWNAKEVLAHIAVLSRAYGVFGYMVAKGKLPELPMEGVISQRDIVGAEMAAKSVAEIIEEIDRQNQRTLTFLSQATAEELRRTVKIESGDITADYLIRLPLVSHFEQHIEQLEAALA